MYGNVKTILLAPKEECNQTQRCILIIDHASITIQLCVLGISSLLYYLLYLIIETENVTNSIICYPWLCYISMNVPFIIINRRYKHTIQAIFHLHYTRLINMEECILKNIMSQKVKVKLCTLYLMPANAELCYLGEHFYRVDDVLMSIHHFISIPVIMFCSSKSR